MIWNENGANNHCQYCFVNISLQEINGLLHPFIGIAYHINKQIQQNNENQTVNVKIRNAMNIWYQ